MSPGWLMSPGNASLSMLSPLRLTVRETPPEVRTRRLGGGPGLKQTVTTLTLSVA